MEPPLKGFVKVNVDGGYIEDSNVMGAGGILITGKGGWIRGFPSWEGSGKSFLAELLTVHKGPLLAWDGGFKQVYCEFDFVDVVSLIRNMEALTFYEFAAITMEVVELLERSWVVKIQHVFREASACSDFLAKFGARNKDDRKIWQDPIRPWELSC